MTFTETNAVPGEAAMRSRVGDLDLLLGTRRGLIGGARASLFWLGLDRKTRVLVRAARRQLGGNTPAAKDVAKAAALLMAAGFARGALELLQDHSLHRETADLLKMLGCTREAGKRYARAGLWVLAEGCFQQIGDRAGIAYCTARQGKYSLAAQVYEQAGDASGAALCHARAGSWRKAAQLYASLGRQDASLHAYKNWLATDADAAEATLDEGEADLVVKLLTAARFEVALVPLLAANGKLLPLLAELLRQDRHRLAVEVYAAHREELGVPLAALASGDRTLAERALAVCLEVDDQGIAARLYERMELWGEAITAFQRAGDMTSAYACCVRAELWDKLAELKSGGGQMSGSQPAFPSTPRSFAAAADASVLSQPGLIGMSSHLLPSPLSDPAAPSADIVLAGLAADGNASGPADPGFPGVFGTARFFDNLPLQDRETLWGIGVVRRFNQSQILVDFGDQPAGTFTILDGDVRIFKRHGNGEVAEVDQVSKHGTFGESWLLMSLRADVRIVAASDCTVHVIERQTLGRTLTAAAPDTEKLFSRLACNLARHLVSRINPQAFTVSAVQNQGAAAAVAA